MLSDPAYRDLTNASKEATPYKEGGSPTTVTQDLAVVKIIEWLSKPEGRRKARHALEVVRGHARRQEKPKRLPFSVWQTLDDGFFEGKLSPAIYCNWDSSVSSSLPGVAYAAGSHHHNGRRVERIAVLLSPRFFFKRKHNTKEIVMDEMIAALLHQMLHAYFLHVCVPFGKKPSQECLSHGEGFWKVMHEIGALSKETDSRFRNSRGWEFAEIMQRLYKPTGHDHQHKSLLSEDLSSGEHTNCRLEFQKRVDREKANEWYKQISSAAKEDTGNDLYTIDPNTLDVNPVPRHEKGSPIDHIEVLWDGKAFSYQCNPIESNIDSLTRMLTTSGKRQLSLPHKIDRTSFALLDSFLKSGVDYSPPLPGLGSYPSGIPILSYPLHNPTNQPNLLLHDVLAYKLGCALSIPELCNRALSRLNTARKVHADPIPALAEIYNTQSPFSTLAYPTFPNTAKNRDPAAESSTYDTPTPPEALRTWARAFMLATPASAAGTSSTATVGYSASNLFQMDKFCGDAGVEGLLASSQSRELEQDYGIVVALLWERTPVNLRLPGGVWSGGGEFRVRKAPVDGWAVPGAVGSVGAKFGGRSEFGSGLAGANAAAGAAANDKANINANAGASVGTRPMNVHIVNQPSDGRRPPPSPPASPPQSDDARSIQGSTSKDPDDGKMSRAAPPKPIRFPHDHPPPGPPTPPTPISGSGSGSEAPPYPPPPSPRGRARDVGHDAARRERDQRKREHGRERRRRAERGAMELEEEERRRLATERWVERGGNRRGVGVGDVEVNWSWSGAGGGGGLEEDAGSEGDWEDADTGAARGIRKQGFKMYRDLGEDPHRGHRGGWI